MQVRHHHAHRHDVSCCCAAAAPRGMSDAVPCPRPTLRRSNHATRGPPPPHSHPRARSYTAFIVALSLGFSPRGRPISWNWIIVCDILGSAVSHEQGGGASARPCLPPPHLARWHARAPHASALPLNHSYQSLSTNNRCTWLTWWPASTWAWCAAGRTAPSSCAVRKSCCRRREWSAPAAVAGGVGVRAVGGRCGRCSPLLAGPLLASPSPADGRTVATFYLRNGLLLDVLAVIPCIIQLIVWLADLGGWVRSCAQRAAGGRHWHARAGRR